MQLGLQILFLLFPVCKPSPGCISGFHIYEQTPSTSLSVLSLPPLMPQSVSHLHMYTYEYSVNVRMYVHMCVHLLSPLFRRTLNQMLLLSSINECYCF